MRSHLCISLFALGACSSSPPAVLTLAPAQTLALGTVTIGNTASATITVSNTGQTVATDLGNGASTLNAFSFTGGTFPGTGGTCATSLAFGSACTVSITFTPTAATSQTGIITLNYFDGQAAQNISEQLTGTGQNPPVVVTTSSFDPSVYQPSDAAVGQTVDAKGTFVTGATGSTPVISAMKAAADDSITIIALSSAAEEYLLVDQVTNPAGTVITSANYFDKFGDYTAAEINRAYPSQGAQAMMIPQSPDYMTETGTGTYSFVITAIDVNSDFAPGVSVDVYIVHQLASTTAVAEPHVNVNLFFSGSAGLDAATAQTDAADPTNPFAQILSVFVNAWGEQASGGVCAGNASSQSLGLCIDSINFYDLPSGYADISGDFTEDTAGEKDLTEVFEQSAGHTPGVNFYFLDEITLDGISSNSGSERLLGVDGNIPSPGAFMGTPRSGAAVVLDTLPTDATDIQRVGATIAHEGGHYLGLYHVQEADCSADNLSDTPCDPTCTTNSSNKHQASTSGCTGSTQDTNQNMMFWASTQDYQQLYFTSEQAETVRRHPLVH